MSMSPDADIQGPFQQSHKWIQLNTHIFQVIASDLLDHNAWYTKRVTTITAPLFFLRKMPHTFNTASIYVEQYTYISPVIDAPSKLCALSEQMDIIVIIYMEIASYTLKHMILW